MEKDIKSSSQVEEAQNEPSSTADSQELQTSDSKAQNDGATQAKEDLSSENELKPADKSPKMFDSKIDKDLHDKILEKLDIKQKNDTQDIQEKNLQEQPKPDANFNDAERIKTKIQVEQAISQDFAKIQKLVESGLINSAQGQNLKKQVLKKAFDMLVQTEKAKRALPQTLEKSGQLNNPVNKNKVSEKAFEEFGKSNPDFFTSDGRKEVLNYLKSNDVVIGKDELNQISGIIRTVEKAAIDRYLQNAAHEKTLKDSNETAKQRLTANAQKSSLSGNLSRTFTREQIGKMSSAEFAKYESMIMEQLKKGQIK